MIIGVAAVVAAYFVIVSQLGQAPPPVTIQVWEGSVTSPASFPTVLDPGNAPLSVTYHVKTRQETRPSGAGMAYPPTNVTRWQPVSGADVTFRLSSGNATFADESTRKTVTPDGPGDATVELQNTTDGSDGLNFSYTISLGMLSGSRTVNDPAVQTFEVSTR